MKLYEFLKLTEMPVRDFYVDDSVEAGQSNWNSRDARMVSSPKIEQLARQRIKTAVPIDMVFMDIGANQEAPWETPEGDMSRTFHRMLEKYSGVMTAMEFRNAFGHAMSTTPDGITAVFFSNTQDRENKIGMTPWIMVHRMAHSLLDAAAKGQLGDTAKINVAPFNEVFDTYLTMKSARTGKMASGEAPVEAMTQFLHDGEIRTPRVQRVVNDEMVVLTNGHEVYADDAELLDEEMEDLEEQLNISANIIVNAAIGKVVVAP